MLVRKGTFEGEAAAGEQWLSLENHTKKPGGEISQTFATTPGRMYTLSFRYNSLALGGARKLTYAIGDDVQTLKIDTGDIPTTQWSPWQTATFNFKASANTSTLSFKGEQFSGFHGPAIDDVRVHAAAE